jgi:uncharacterized protein with PIN domain
VTDPTAGVLYADTSALVKLVVREAESDAIEAEVSRRDRIATSDIAAIELPVQRLALGLMAGPASRTAASFSNSSPRS